MANLFQKIFLSDKKLLLINQQQEILQLISDANIVEHKVHFPSNGNVVRSFNIVNPGWNINATRIYEHHKPEGQQIKFLVSYNLKNPKLVKYATNSDIDKFAEKAYTKMHKIWEQSRQHVK